MFASSIARSTTDPCLTSAAWSTCRGSYKKDIGGASFKKADDELLNVEYQGWLEKKMAEFDDLKNVNKAYSLFS